MLVFVLALLTVASALAQKQPIEFTHKLHIAQGLACLDCHSTADTQAAATLPSVYKCMLCHEKIATDGPGVQILRQYAAERRSPPWVRVYGFAESAHVKFRHAAHVRAEISCQRCHGNVAEMTTAQPVVRHDMGSCVTCHRENQASDDCAVCHY